jgi:hypothetical protein
LPDIAAVMDISVFVCPFLVFLGCRGADVRVAEVRLLLVGA